MDNFTATELAYKNGYEQGKKDAVKWISIEERLPSAQDANPNGSVLAILKEEGFAKSWWHEIVARYPKEFTYWMPMPKPPK